MAPGTYIRLELDPGTYELSIFRGMLYNDFKYFRKDVSVSVIRRQVDVIKGKETFIEQSYGVSSFLTNDPVLVEASSVDDARSTIATFSHMRYDLENRTIAQYVDDINRRGRQYLENARLRKEMAQKAADEQRSKQGDAQSSQAYPSASDSSATFASLLEGLAAVLLIGLVVAGAAYGHSVPMYVPPSRPYNPPALIQQIDTDRAGSYNFSGDRIIGGTKQEEWQIRGRKIIGSNGTEYTINSAGTRIYGNNGQSYQFSQSGRRVDGSDGSYCEYVGVNRTLKCSAPK